MAKKKKITKKAAAAAQKKVAKALSNRPKVDKPEEQRNVGNIEAKLNDPRPVGYGNAPIPQTERGETGLDPRDVEADAADVATVKKLEAEPPKVDTALVSLVQERRRQQKAAESGRVIPLETAVAGVEAQADRGDITEPTPGQERFQESQRGGSAGTGNIDYKFLPAAPPSEKPAGPGLIGKFGARAERGSGLQNPPLSVSQGEPQVNVINSTARRLAKGSLLDNGVEPTEENITSELVNNTSHEQKARVMAYTGLSHDDIVNYMGRNEREGRNRLSTLHETVMQFHRSRQKHDVARDMGLIRNGDGSFTPTPEADNQYWQHPTETVRMPVSRGEMDVRKTYRVSDMHPDMIKELNHPSGWGGYSGNADFEGVTGSAASGTVDPVIRRFGHSKSGPQNAQTWKFTAPPAGWGEDSSIEGIKSDHITMLGAGITPNVTNLIERVRQGYKGSVDLGTAEKPKRDSGKLDIAKPDSEDVETEGDRSRKRRVFGAVTRGVPTVNNIQVAIGTPGALRGTESAESDPDFPAKVTVTPGRETFINKVEYEEKKFKKPRRKKGKGVIVGLKGEGIPGTFDAAGNPVPLPPRAGRRGGTTVIVDPETGKRVQRRAVLSRQTGLQTSVRSAAEASAETLIGQNEVAEEILKGNRSQQFRQLIAPPAPTGQIFMGPPKKKPEQQVIEGLEKGNFSLNQEEVESKPIQRRVVEGPISRTQYNMEQAATGGTGYFEKYVGNSDKKELVTEPIAQSTSSTIRQSVNDPTFGRVTVTVDQPKPERSKGNNAPTKAIGQKEFKEITARQREADAADAAAAKEAENRANDRSPLPGQYMFDFQDPAKPGAMISRQFLGGQIRPLTDVEASVEQSGWNTIRGMNPRGIKDRPTQQTPPSSGQVDVSKQPDGLDIPPATPLALPFQGYTTNAKGEQVAKEETMSEQLLRVRRRAVEQNLRDELAADRSPLDKGESLVSTGDVQTGQEGISVVKRSKKSGDKVTRRLRAPKNTIRNERNASKKQV